MLTRPPSRVNLSAADITDFERRWAARRPVRPSRPPPANARLSVGAAQLTKLGYVPASANLGRKRAESCSSQATICTIADDEAIHSGDEHSPDPLLSPTRPLSERASIRLDHAVGRDTISIADSIEPTSPRRRSPQKLPAHFTIHEEDTLDQAETEARHLRNPQIFRMAVADDICDRLATFAPELVRSTAEVAGIAEQQLDADTVLNPSLDAEAPVFVPRARFGTVANDLPDDSHGGIGHDGANSSSTQAPPTHLRVQSSFERNSQRSSQQSERDNASSSRTETLPPVRLVQSRRRSRTQDQNAAIQRTVPDLDRYPTMPPLPHVVGMHGRRSSAAHRRVVPPQRRSSRAHQVEYERSRMAQIATGMAGPSRRADMRAPYQDRLRAVSPAPSSSSRSTPNLLLRGPPAPAVYPRSSSFSSNRAVVLQETRLFSVYAGDSSDLLSSQAFEDNYLNRDSPLEELAKQVNHLAARQSQRSVGRSLERLPGTQRPSLLNGVPFRLDSPERSSNRPPIIRSPPPQSRAPCPGHAESRGAVQQAIEKYQRAHEALAMQTVSPRQTSAEPVMAPVHRSQTQSSLSSAFEDPVAFALALPPDTVPLSPASTPLPSSPRSPSPVYSSNSTHIPSTPPIHSPAASPRHSTASRSSIARMPQSLDAAVSPRVIIYNDDKSPSTQPQTPADITRSGRRFRPRSDMGSMHHHTPMTTLAETPSHAAMERNLHRNTYPTATPSNHEVGQDYGSGMTPARQQISMSTSAQSAQRAGRRRDRSENEAEAHLANVEGLEQDRRVWIGRQEDGGLDVTPPREGRWERYLS